MSLNVSRGKNILEQKLIIPQISVKLTVEFPIRIWNVNWKESRKIR